MEKKAILIVNFGSTHMDTREKTYAVLKKRVMQCFPDYEVREAYLSETIIRILKKREGLTLETTAQALDRLQTDGYREVIICPTLFTNAIEYDRLSEIVDNRKNDFSSLQLGDGLLSREEDLKEIMQILDREYAIKENPDTAFVFMGHGSEHPASAIYAALDYRLKHSGYTNAFVGAVEGYPDIQTVIADVNRGGFRKAILAPLMMVAGDHARNDMTGNDDSWTALLCRSGVSAVPVIRGMGEMESVRNIMIRHIREVSEH